MRYQICFKRAGSREKYLESTIFNDFYEVKDYLEEIVGKTRDELIIKIIKIHNEKLEKFVYQEIKEDDSAMKHLNSKTNK